MAYIKTLKDNELIGGTDNTDVYPVTTTQAIYSQRPDGRVPEGIKHQKLEDRLEDHEEDALELHRKAEKLAVYIENDKEGLTLEIDGTSYIMSIAGYANVEYFGDEPSISLNPSDLSAKALSVLYSSASTSVPGNVSGNKWVGTYSIPNVVGKYTAKFECTYQGTSKSAEASTNLNLRKFIGFASEQPTGIETLPTSHFSNSVECTVTILPDGTGFKHIYLAIPNGMTITSVTQPDAFNAPLPVQEIGTITRTIGGTNYTYKLYESEDLIDSAVPKSLTIK